METQQISAPALALPGATDLFSSALGALKAQWKTLLGIQVLITLFATVPISLLQLIGQGNAGSVLDRGVLGLIGFLAFLFVCIPIASWGQAALLQAIKARSQPISINEAYRRAKSQILPLIWINILNCILIAGGMLFFLVPGILFSVWFSFSGVILVAEGLRGTQALLQSKGYVRGNFGAIFWRFFLMGLIYFGIVICVGIVSFILALVAGPHAAVLVGVVSQAMSISLSAIWQCAFMVYLYLLYERLHAAKGTLVPGKSTKLIVAIAGALFMCVFVFPVILSVMLVSLSAAREKALEAQQQAAAQMRAGQSTMQGAGPGMDDAAQEPADTQAAALQPAQ